MELEAPRQRRPVLRSPVPAQKSFDEEESHDQVAMATTQESEASREARRESMDVFWVPIEPAKSKMPTPTRRLSLSRTNGNKTATRTKAMTRSQSMQSVSVSHMPRTQTNMRYSDIGPVCERVREQVSWWFCSFDFG